MDSETSVAEKQRTKRQYEPPWCWIALAAMTYNMFVIDGSVRCYGLLYKELIDLFEAGPQRTGYVATVFAVCGAVASPFAGLLMDKLSARILLLFLPIVTAFGAFVSAFSTSLGMIFFGYSCLIGASNTSCFVANTAEVTRLFKYNRTIATGIIFAGGSVGSMVFPLLFTVLANIYTVRGVFIIMYAGLALNIIVSSFILRFEKVYKEIPVEYEMSELGLDEKLDKLEDDRNQNTGEGVAEEAKLMVEQNEKKILGEEEMPEVVMKEKKSHMKECLETARKLINIKFISLVLFYVTWVFSLYGFQMYIPAYGEDLHLSKLQCSLLLSACAAADLISRLLIGFVGKFLNIYILITVNMTITGIFNIFVPTLLSTGDIFSVLMSAMVIIGLVVGGLTSLLGQLVAEAVGTDFAGTAFGILNVSFCTGIGLPPLVYGRMKEVTGSYSSVSQITGAVMIISGFLIQIGRAWNRCKRKKSHKTSVN